MEGDIIFERVRTWERHFNPLPPHGGRPFYQTDDICYEWISIHSLRMEGDKLRSHQLHYYKTFQSTPSAWRETCKTRLSGSTHRFQSTPSAWRETSGKLSNSQIHKISIHSLRMEGDQVCAGLHRGGCVFQSTPSAWRETAKLHRKAFFISPILVQSCKKGCKRLHSAPEKMVFFEKREKNLVRNLQHLSVRL